MGETSNLLDQFAMAALTGLLSNRLAEPRYSGNLIYAAKEAYEIAGEMMTQRAAFVGPSEAAPNPPSGKGWISVEDRLPGDQGHDSEDVLVFINGHCDLHDMACREGGAWGLAQGWYESDRGYFRVGGAPNDDVTHWMPKPDKPPLATPEPEGGEDHG